MSGIAHLLFCRGVRVSGSEIKESKITSELKGMGLDIFIGHNAFNIKGADLVVYSSAIKEDNPEIQEARKLGIPVIKRAEALAGLMTDKAVITVTGSHGKTTTTSLVSYLLLEAGISPSVAIGGILRNIDANACMGEGEFFVAEADESDGSFLYYHPKYSIITNIDHEHLDYYKDFNSEISAFKKFLHNTTSSGCVFACGDDRNLRGILKDYGNKYLLFGIEKDNDVYPENIKLGDLSSDFDCIYKGKLIGSFHLELAGLHNISNALSVIALGLELGIDVSVIKRALCGYKGAKRRMEIKFKNQNYLVIDDYAHHPTEIRATLKALDNLKFGRMIVVFQPHRYTRTKLLLNEFGRSFDSADYIIVTEVYAASEPPIEGINGQSLSHKIKEHSSGRPVHFIPKQDIVTHILDIIKPNDLVVMLGAGDIIKTCDDLVEKLKTYEAKTFS